MIGPIMKDRTEALLVPVDNALAECMAWGKQDITKHQFLKILEDKNVLVFRTIDDFAKTKAEKKTQKETEGN